MTDVSRDKSRQAERCGECGQVVGEPKRIHRVNVNFSDDAWRTLKDLARRKGKTISEVIRDAIALEMWAQNTWESGARILVEHDWRVHELIPR
jgi:hypothetical protein